MGKILNYEVNENIVLVNYKNIQCTVTIINDSVINFFVPIFRKERNSKDFLKISWKNCVNLKDPHKHWYSGI